MNDSLAVGSTECVRNLDSQAQHFLKRKRLAGNSVFQRVSVEKLHRNKRLTVVFPNLIDGANIRMVKSGGSLCLTLEAAQRLRVWRVTVGKELQGNEAVKLGVFSFIDDAHPTASEAFKDAVVGDGLAGERVRALHAQHMLGVGNKASQRRQSLSKSGKR